MTLYSNSKAEIIINESGIDDLFQSIYTRIISHIQKSLGRGSGWIIDSAIDNSINIPKYNLLAGSSYKKLPKQLSCPWKWLINIHNIGDNEFFKWSIVRYLNPTDHNLRWIIKEDKDFPRYLDFKGVKFPTRIRDIHWIEKKNYSGISVYRYENKEKHPIYVSK